MTAVISLTTALVSDDGSYSDSMVSKRQKLKVLRSVALDIFHAAAIELATFNTVAAVFQQGMETCTISEWMTLETHLEGEEDDLSMVPGWVKANM